jgi:ankyrin repeat protein
MTNPIRFFLTDKPSSLWIACQIGNEDLAREIIALGPTIVQDDPAPDGTTAFAIALANGQDNIVDFLLDDVKFQPKDRS